MLEICNLKKYYGDRLLLDIKDFKAYSGDKIGIVGANGTGKTILLDIIAGSNEVSGGYVKCYGDFSYIAQLEDSGEGEIDNHTAKNRS
ncbi:MAG: ATP-binding cassette domain-containing protein [Caulobacteraceae bacterium]